MRRRIGRKTSMPEAKAQGKIAWRRLSRKTRAPGRTTEASMLKRSPQANTRPLVMGKRKVRDVTQLRATRRALPFPEHIVIKQRQLCASGTETPVLHCLHCNATSGVLERNKFIRRHDAVTCDAKRAKRTCLTIPERDRVLQDANLEPGASRRLRKRAVQALTLLH